MEKEAIGTGLTVTEAQQNACSKLGLETHETEFEILQLPEKKKFGLFGGSLAKVRAFIKVSPVEKAKEYLINILKSLGLKNINIEVKEEENSAVFDLTGDNTGLIIGRRGETLYSLQYLASLVANNAGDSYYRITLNTGNYKEKREKTLINLAKKITGKSLRTGRNISLEPMNAYERRIIHTEVQNIEGVISWSEGKELDRHVVVGPEKKKRVKFNPNTNTKDSVQRNLQKNKIPYKDEEKSIGSKYDKIVSAPEVEEIDESNKNIKKHKDEDPISSLYGKINQNH